MTKRARRARVAVSARKLPEGALGERDGGKMGRPKKVAGEKAKPITVTLWPEELAALETYRTEVFELPLSRSDAVRVAIALLLKTPRAQALKVLRRVNDR